MADAWQLLAFVERLRRKAKRMRRETGIPHHEALDIVAYEAGGWRGWRSLVEGVNAVVISLGDSPNPVKRKQATRR